jgi:hypothetical protein
MRSCSKPFPVQVNSYIACTAVTRCMHNQYKQLISCYSKPASLQPDIDPGGHQQALIHHRHCIAEAGTGAITFTTPTAAAATADDHCAGTRPHTAAYCAVHCTYMQIRMQKEQAASGQDIATKQQEHCDRLLGTAYGNRTPYPEWDLRPRHSAKLGANSVQNVNFAIPLEQDVPL